MLRNFILPFTAKVLLEVARKQRSRAFQRIPMISNCIEILIEFSNVEFMPLGNILENKIIPTTNTKLDRSNCSEMQADVCFW